MIKSCIFALSALAVFASCNSWLDVEPTDKIDDKKLFKDAQGFRSSLNGIYGTLASQSLYGRNLTWGMTSFLGQDYVTDAGGTADKAAQRFNYQDDNFKAVASSVWTTAYNVIANCNKLIMEMESKDESFFPQGKSERDMILGEAIGIRAMLHFEIARLFAPAPALNDTKSYVPYYRDFKINFEPAIPTTQMLDRVIEDLLEAKDLLALNDTITNPTYLFSSNSEVRLNAQNTTAIDIFFTGRGLRLNYVAINGLLARAYLYAGDIANARKYALYVYSKYSPDATVATTNTWYFTQVTGMGTYVKLIDDVLFALSDKTLVTKVEKYATDLGKPLYLRGIRTGLESKDASDYRWRLIEMDGANERCLKWHPSETTGSGTDREYALIPVIRMSEIYYILTETMLSSDLAEAEKVFREVRSARGESRSVIGKEAIREELDWEYRKEFMTEGQTYFLFKRLNKAIRTTDGTVTPEAGFTVPVPDNERAS